MRTVPILSRLDAEAKLRFKSAVPGWYLSRVRPNAIRTVRGGLRKPHGTEIPLFAMVCTWLEQDIVYASVSNAFDQGARRVYLIDNGSPDETIAEAVSAGATHVLTFNTERFDELFKYELINDHLEHLSRQSGLDKVWWMLMDADEFNSAPGGSSIREFLGTVDARCRVIGARVLDHFPSPEVEYTPRTHPMSAQPKCREKVDHRCMLGHHKHPIFLWDRRRKPIVVEPGFHQVRCKGEALYEPAESLILDHFPFRNEPDMRRRLRLLMVRGVTEATRRADADAHMRARLESLDAVYRGDFTKVIDYRTGLAGITVCDRSEVLRSP